MRSEVFTAAKIHIATFWHMLDGQLCLGGTYCLQCQGTMKMRQGVLSDLAIHLSDYTVS